MGNLRSRGSVSPKYVTQPGSHRTWASNPEPRPLPARDVPIPPPLSAWPLSPAVLTSLPGTATPHKLTPSPPDPAAGLTALPRSPPETDKGYGGSPLPQVSSNSERRRGVTFRRIPMDQKPWLRASPVAQWLRVRLPMQGTRVHAPVQEDTTCHGAAGPVSHGR